MMALCPDTVDMADYSAEKWYVESAPKATRELGEQGVAMILERMRKLLKK